MRHSAPHRMRLALAVCVGTLHLASGPATGQDARAPAAPQTRAAAVSGFAPVGDVQMYYEVYGAGEPILFIHGGGGSVAGSWPSDYVTELSREFRVILADSRGHGRTADGTGPITYGRLTFDAVRLLDHLGIDRVHVVGHSMGAITGLHLLVDFPDRVRTVTMLAGAYHVDNYRPVAAGQDTFVAPSVAKEMHAHIKGSELIVFPEATHRVQVTNVKELVPAIRDFIRRR